MPNPTKPANKAKATKAFKICNSQRDKMSDTAYERCVNKVYQQQQKKSKK